MRLKNSIFCFTLLFFCLFSIPLFSQELPKVGVPLDLAEQRRVSLTDIHYDLFLDLPEDSTANIIGRETISFNYVKRMPFLVFDFKESEKSVKAVILNGVPVSFKFVNEHIILSDKLFKSGRNKIDISFIAGNTPLIRRKEYMYTLLVPERARMFIPCFDQPDLKATFKLHAIVPSNWEVISNGPLVKKYSKGNRKILDFAVSDKISTYLFSVVAGKFKKESRLIGGHRMNFYYRETDPNKIACSMDTIFALHGASLQFLEKYTSVKYPFKKFDFIALSDLAYGGMEHVGAIDYRSSSLFLNSNADLKQKINRINLIAHETSHMWFGNLVTMQWFNDVWMKEVFANFMADKVLNELMPGYDNRLSFMLAHAPAAYAIDRTEGAHSIRQPLNNLNDAASLYGNIIYHKAPMAMNQLELIIGKEKFQKALQTYMKRYAYGNATWTGLIDILKEEGAKDIGKWNNNWINGSGRPRISCKLEEYKGKVSKFTIWQKDQQGQPIAWSQQLSVAFVFPDTIERFNLVLDRDSIDVDLVKGHLSPQCIIFNAGGEGYGLFPVDDKSVPLLETLRDDQLRATTFINLYENVLEGRSLTPVLFIKHVCRYLDRETNDLLISQMIGGIERFYWQFITPQQRQLLASELEQSIAGQIIKAQNITKKRSLFKLYVNIASSKDGVDQLYSCWKSKVGLGNIKLDEDELTSIALGMALRDYPGNNEILNEQERAIKNADRRARFNYIRLAVSSEESERSRFYYSLKSDKKNEQFIGVALAYLHHPLRQETSRAYLHSSLEWLEDIKAHSGIFFPTDWLRATFGNYQSRYAVDLVRDYLASHPNLEPSLRLKILQECDGLFKSRHILDKQGLL